MEDREVERFWEWLISEEKSRATVDKYMRDIFYGFVDSPEFRDFSGRRFLA